MSERDRDPQGRAQNSRPRDSLGRPLPPGSAGVPRIPDELVLPPREALVRAQELLDDGMPFHAHEILEGTWKAAPDEERELWQGLAQLCVGLTHLARGNARGGRALLLRAADRLDTYAGQRPYAVRTEELAAFAREVAGASVAQAVPPPRLVQD
ncbi:hypothetical protein EV189_3733 [Motilibacter rhizosphaerae]|uniref:DUF309 family protein family protein n=1 Tax=Motilibacter rhizosphaerae TaxID=598652 RepID=A0A4Q7NAB0_9ACTN|nr:DUF309 domain-containing protein [Motilibacter rhizosphaerae]RZS79381.1 hypothetical protein EV189_3733 [Motilibacter rhizosphaerae]